MAVVNIPKKGVKLTDPADIAKYLGMIGIDYERWETGDRLSGDVADDEILDAYSTEIETLKKRGGYVTADVINVVPTTPGLDEMLNRFNKEHWHDEDEVRFIVKGSGLFHIAPRDGDVCSVEMHPGDLIRVPAGTLHWFDLCGDRTVRAIRLFQDASGWTPHYSGSGVDADYQPVCFGKSYLAGSASN